MIVGLKASREIPLEGGYNFRDIGGYTGAEGRTVRWRQIYRSGRLSNLTSNDWDWMRREDVRAICDLRTIREQQREPCAPPDHVKFSYWSGDFTANFAELSLSLAQSFLSAEQARAGMIAGYRRLPFDLAGAYRQLFAYLLHGDYPLILNCTAGKDRTGVGVALILMLLGVSRDEIIADYELTNNILAHPCSGRERVKTRLKGVSTDVQNAIGRADPDYLLSALAGIDDTPNGLKGYARQLLGLRTSDWHRLRKKLLT